MEQDMTEPGGPVPRIRSLLDRAGMVEDPHVDAVLAALLHVLDGGLLGDDGTGAPATADEIGHAAALARAFRLHLVPDGGSRRTWAESHYAAHLDDRFERPGPLGSTPEAAVDVWELYASTDLPPFITAHLWDLVAERHRSLPDSAVRAVAALRDLKAVVPDVYAADHLARALELVAQFNLEDLQGEVEQELLQHASDALEAGGGPGTFVRSIRPLVDRGLRPTEVGVLLERAGSRWSSNTFAADSLFELSRELASDAASRTAIERAHVEARLDQADGAEHGIAALMLYQEAHAVADQFGHTDLASRAISGMRAISPDSLGLESFTVTAQHEPGFVDQQIRAIVGRDNLVAGLGRAVSSCPTGDVADVRARAEAGEGSGTFDSIFGSTVLNAELMPKGMHAGDDVDAAIARLQDIRIQMALPLIARALDRLNGAYDIGDPTLPAALAAIGGLTAGKADKLVRCLRRFWREDYEGAAYIGSTLVEGILRERLVAVGRDPYQLPRPDGSTAGKYKMLGQLISMASSVGLDPSWASYLSYALANPMFGPNLRNELLHGTVDGDPGPLSAALVLIAVLHLTVAFRPQAA